MTAESANMSIDFLIGFTIFMMAFIWVSAMIPGILVGLQSNTIDYDAVAYRTGVILMEDPGWPRSPGWESFEDERKADIVRFGLAVSSDTPNLLSGDKVERFFNVSTTNPDIGFVYPEEYQSRVIFGDRPYHFNISLRDVEKERFLAVGEAIPNSHGYIRRLGKIKGASNASLGSTYYTAHKYYNNEFDYDNVTIHEFAFEVDRNLLSTEIKDPNYQIDPTRDMLIMNLTQLRSTLKTEKAVGANISAITVYAKTSVGIARLGDMVQTDYPYVDGNTSRVDNLPFPVSDNVSFVFRPKEQFFANYMSGFPELLVNVTFTLDTPAPYLNTSKSGPFVYNYHPDNVTQPQLRDAVMEVAVW